MTGKTANGSVLLGPGPRLRELARVLSALAPDEGVAIERVEDPDELLEERGGEGRLVLDTDHLSAEDIGFVRRFLKRHPGWETVLLAEDTHKRALTLMGSPGVSLADRVLAWPPRLDQLLAFLGAPSVDAPASGPGASAASTQRGPSGAAGDLSAPAGPGGPGTPAPLFHRLQELQLAGRHLRREMAGGGDPSPLLERLAGSLEGLAEWTRGGNGEGGVELLDLDRLLDEELAGEMLSGGGPRTEYRAEGDLHLFAPRRPLEEALSGLLRFAKKSAGAESVVDVRAEAPGDPDTPILFTIDLAADDLPAEAGPKSGFGGLFAAYPGAGSDLGPALEALDAMGADRELIPVEEGDRLVMAISLPRHSDGQPKLL